MLFLPACIPALGCALTKFVNSAITVLCPPAEVEGVFQSPGLIRGPDPTELPPSPESENQIHHKI